MRFSVSAYDIAQSAGGLVEIVQKSATGPENRAPQMLLIAPPPLARLEGRFAAMFDGGPPKAMRFAEEYGRVTQERGCHFLNAGSVIVSSDLDGIHFEASEHAKLGQAVAQSVQTIFT
jgi:hypothetical protein